MAEAGAPGDRLPPSLTRRSGHPSGRGAGLGRDHHRHRLELVQPDERVVTPNPI